MTALLADRERGEGSETAGPARRVRLADWLGLAAAPSFAVLAILGAATSRPDPVCAAGMSSFPFGDMPVMYLLMSLFHLPPWLRLVFGRGRG